MFLILAVSLIYIGILELFSIFEFNDETCKSHILEKRIATPIVGLGMSALYILVINTVSNFINMRVRILLQIFIPIFIFALFIFDRKHFKKIWICRITYTVLAVLGISVLCDYTMKPIAYIIFIMIVCLVLSATQKQRYFRNPKNLLLSILCAAVSWCAFFILGFGGGG
jgi:hypothetical protein